MCTPPFPATVYPPHTPMKDSLPVLLVCRGTEKRTKHRETLHTSNNYEGLYGLNI